MKKINNLHTDTWISLFKWVYGV